MTILQINKFFYLRGGSERYFFDLSEALEDEGHDVIYFSMKHPKNRESEYSKYFIDEVDFTRNKSLKKAEQFVYSKDAAKNLEFMLEMEGQRGRTPDIVHVHNIAHQLTPAILDVLRWKKIPVVQTLHDYQLLCPNYKMYTQGSPCERCNAHKYWNAVRYKCVQDSRASSMLSAYEMGFHNVLRKTYERGIKQFIAPSKFMYQKLLEWGWSEDQVTYIPHFVDKKRDPKIQKKQMVVFVGRLTEEKGIDVLLDAAQLIDSVDIVLAGEGDEKMEKKIRERIAKEKLNAVKMIGFQDTPALDRLMQEAAAVIVPSLWYENAPMVVYEALALGTPVIATNHGGLPELIQDGHNGYLVEPRNPQQLAKAIHRITHAAPNDPPLQIRENRYTKTSHLRQIEQLYADILDAKK